MWIWQQPSWPEFEWVDKTVAPLLREARLRQGILLGKLSSQPIDQQESMLDSLLANIVHSSAIEGEQVNVYSVRSSLAKKLGVTEEVPFPTTTATDGLADILLDAVSNHESPLTLERILGWHQHLFPTELLFPTEQTVFNQIQGGVLRGNEPMQMVSGRIDRPTIHFIAPDRARLETELTRFIDWFNQTNDQGTLDPLLRAAISHLWFVTLHPLEDGNGRITRLITDLALAQAEQQSVRFYAMSVTILTKRKSYYEILEHTQKGDLDVTSWLVWFLETLTETFDDVIQQIDQTLFKTRYWQAKGSQRLSVEQTKVLNRMLDGDFELGINASQYHKVAKVSRPTATRHLTSLLEWGYLTRSEAGGRSTRYFLSKI